MKLISLTKLFAICAAVTTISSCSKDETLEVIPDAGETLKIETSVLSRVSRATTVQTGTSEGPVMGSNLSTGDKIGVSIYNAGYNTNYQGMADTATHNLAWTLIGTKWTPAAPFYLQNSTADIYAYYPYDNAATNMSELVVAPGYTDYLYGKSKQSVSKPSPNAEITLDHALSMISFTFTRQNYPGECKLNSIILRQLPNNGTMDLRTGIVKTGTATDSLAVKYYNEGVYTSGIWQDITIPATDTIGNVTGNNVAPAFHALVLPASTLPGDTTSLHADVTIDGATYAIPLNIKTDSNEWQRGKHYTYNLTLKGKDLVVSTVTINQWINGGSSDIEI